MKKRKRINLEKEKRKIVNKINQAEAEIIRLEEEIAKCDHLLANPSENPGIMNDTNFFSKYTSLKKSLTDTTTLWEDLHIELEQFD